MTARMLIRSLLLAACVCVAPGAVANDKQPGEGDVAPTPLGLSRDGDKLETTQYKGRILVVTFWASWCAPCRAELPVLEGLQIAMGKERVQVVAVNIEDRDQFKRISRNMPAFNLQIAHDLGKRAHDAYGVKGIPHLVIIGRDGKIVRRYIGYNEDSIAYILEDIKKALAAG